MATNERSSVDREFIIGNRAQELFVAVIARQLGEGKIAPEKAAESYRSWREHAMQGDCRKLVLSMDERFRRHLKSAGFELKIESYRKNNKIKERVTICREHSAS